MSNAVRCRTFDQFGAPKAEFKAAIEFANWRLNNIGMTRFVMAMTDDKATQENLRVGNLLLLQFENGLPDWGGIVDAPRVRRYAEVSVTGFSAEAIYLSRRTAKTRAFTATVPGSIYQTLIEEENAIWPTRVTIGSIYGGGIGRTLTYHYHQMAKRFKDLARLTGGDFYFEPVVSNEALSFTANWAAKRGQDLSGTLTLKDGANVSEVNLKEEGPIYNSIVLAGSGASWSDRIISEVSDLDSINLYGYREYFEMQGGVKNQETLDENAAELLAFYKQPRKRFKLKAVNRSPATFAQYGIGDRLRLVAFPRFPEWSFDGTVRVIAREWTPDNVCRLEVTEVVT